MKWIFYKTAGYWEAEFHRKRRSVECDVEGELDEIKLR